MIKDAHEANETAMPSDFELARLRAALPEYFDKDGGFLIDRLEDALRAGEVNLTREGYELKFLGKSYAKYLTSTRTETVVVPDLKHNAESANEDSENLYIVGDNLDALKHLIGSYSGQVKFIYIDPPYNTGSDGFVYVDDFGFTAKQLVEKIGLGEEEANRVIDLQGKSSHSAWLTFMYPRLELAKLLLAEDGIILISIDDNEQSNLRALCDEVFGEQNAVATFIWKSKSGGANDSGQVAVDHEYVIAYARDSETAATALGLDPLATATTSYNRSDENGRYSLERLDKQNLTYSGSMDYVLTGPDGEEYHLEHKDADSPNAIWRWSKDTVVERASELVFESGHVYTKNYEKDAGKPRSLLIDERFARSRTGSTDMASLFEGKTFFKNPKPVKLISHLIRIATRPDSLVLDFFSGSATTAEAVMAVNAEDGGSRRFILVQLREPVDPASNRYSKAAYAAGYEHIDEIGRARVERAATTIRNKTSADIDYGFRLFRLEEPSSKTLDELQAFDPTANDALFAGDFVSKFALNGTPGGQVALSTWLLQDGYGLTPDLKTVQLAQYELHVCEDSGYVIQPGVTSADLLALVTKLETGELDLSRLVVFGYSVTFSAMHELRQNLKSLKSGRTVSLIERF